MSISLLGRQSTYLISISGWRMKALLHYSLDNVSKFAQLFGRALTLDNLNSHQRHFLVGSYKQISKLDIQMRSAAHESNISQAFRPHSALSSYGGPPNLLKFRLYKDCPAVKSAQLPLLPPSAILSSPRSRLLITFTRLLEIRSDAA